MDVDISKFSTAFDAFAATVKAHPDKSFLCIPAKAGRDYLPEGAEFTYAQAMARIEPLRALYASSGIGHGHRVALLMGNRPEHFFHLFALNALGAGIVPLNPDAMADELLYTVIEGGNKVVEIKSIGKSISLMSPSLRMHLAKDDAKKPEMPVKKSLEEPVNLPLARFTPIRTSTPMRPHSDLALQPIFSSLLTYNIVDMGSGMKSADALGYVLVS